MVLAWATVGTSSDPQERKNYRVYKTSYSTNRKSRVTSNRKHHENITVPSDVLRKRHCHSRIKLAEMLLNVAKSVSGHRGGPDSRVKAKA